MKDRYHIVPAYGFIKRITVKLRSTLTQCSFRKLAPGCNNKLKFFLISDKMKLVFIIFFLKIEPLSNLFIPICYPK